MSASSTQDGISHTLGQTFTQHAPAGVSVALVAEGREQAYAIDETDTVILLSSEMGTFQPGQNEVYTSSVEGYDSIVQLQVYKMECPYDYDTTIQVSGHSHCTIHLLAPYVPIITPDEPVVTMTSSPANPYDYPVGDTTVVTWTASVAGKSNQCFQDVIVHYYRCADLHSPVTDVDGNSYPVVNLGYYCWTGANLRTTHYNDHTLIPNVKTYPSSFAPGVSDMTETFGLLYTWDAAVNNTTRGICPLGWHIPNATESEYVLAAFEPRDLMSNDPQVHWIPTDGTDIYNFHLLPAGYYNSSIDRYEGLFVSAYFWTIETMDSETAIACQFGSACGTSELTPGRKDMGFSVRCVMDYIP